jgi:hypothetical protein
MGTNVAWREPRTEIRSVSSEWFCWFLAVSLFGVGDLVTTIVGLQFEPITEAGPATALLLEQLGLLILPVWKVVTFACCYVFWKIIPSPHNLGIPLALAFVGTLVTAWNTGVFIVVIL